MNTLNTLGLASAFLLCTTSAMAQAPANDDCVNPTVLSVGLTGFDTTMATDSGIPASGGNCNMSTELWQDIWFTFTPAATGSYIFETTDSGSGTFDTKLAIYNSLACPASTANAIACNDDGGVFLFSKITATLTAGMPVLIRIGSYSSSTIEVPASLRVTAPAIPPVNDDCSTAQAVNLGLTAFDSRAATDGTGLELDVTVCDVGPFGNEQIYADVWFLFSPPGTDFYNLGVVGNGNPSFDSRIAVYNQASCPDSPFSVIACDDDSGNGVEALVTSVGLTGGVTYLIRVGSFHINTIEQPAALSISIGSPPAMPPAGDDCSSAPFITSHGVYPFNTAGATTDGSDLAGFCDISPTLDDQVYNDVWFAYTPDIGGCTYISTYSLAGYDTRLAIYDTSFAPSSCPDDPALVIACSDNEVQPPLAPFEAGLDVDLVAGNAYMLRIGTTGPSDTGGPGAVRIASGPAAVFNDHGAQTGSSGCAPTHGFGEYCNGDGGNQLGCTTCPCGNEQAAGLIGGCVNSSGFGTRLRPSGDPSLSLPSGSATDLRFGVSGAPALAFCILNSGDGLAPANMANPCFGLNSGVQSTSFDGLRCAIMNTRRHGGRSADANGEVGVTNNPWGGEGGPPVGLGNAGGGFAAGQTRFFQIINRDEPLQICMRGLNTSQAIEVTFTP